VTSPYFSHGFWWWYDPNRKGWFVGPSPQIGTPSWALRGNTNPEVQPGSPYFDGADAWNAYSGGARYE
jgi:hypothetical protein